jgi:hypothetical protein
MEKELNKNFNSLQSFRKTENERLNVTLYFEIFKRYCQGMGNRYIIKN